MDLFGFFSFMPCLKYIIENANVKELRLLRGKSIECASLIGLAVGSEKVGSFYTLYILYLLAKLMQYLTLGSFVLTHLKS